MFPCAELKQAWWLQALVYAWYDFVLRHVIRLNLSNLSPVWAKGIIPEKKSIPFGIEITLAQRDHPCRDSSCLQAALCLAQLPDSTALYDASQAMRYVEAHRGGFSSSLPFSSMMCGCMQATDRPTREEAGYRNPEVVPVSL